MSASLCDKRVRDRPPSMDDDNERVAIAALSLHSHRKRTARVGVNLASASSPPCCAGVVYKFEFQVLLLNLASSVALLAIASTAVKFLAFQLLPNRCCAMCAHCFLSHKRCSWFDNHKGPG